MRIAVIGAGGWGTTLADLLSRSGHAVSLWAREPEVVESIRRERINQVFLPASPLHEGLRADGSIPAVLTDADLVVMAVPSHVMKAVAVQVRAGLGRLTPIVVSVSKGLEPNTLVTLTEVLEEVLPGSSVGALSGPSFAQEVYQRQPTAVVAASKDPRAAEAIQQAFSTGYFRVYRSADVIGVQLGGALKNVIAIAAGILEGLGLGNNSRAGLITRGLAEIARLGGVLGADPLTFAGLAGMGDLVLTATGALSRNRSLGIELGQGRSLAEILAERRTVAEGVTTAKSAVDLGRRAGVELPIAAEVSRILFEGKSPRQAIRDLMEREPKAEQWR